MQMQASTTPPGAETETSTAVIDQPPSAREIEMERIAAQIEASSIAAGDFDIDNPPDNPPEKPTEPAATASAAPAERMIKVNVDGVEGEVPESEMVRGYQKEAYANKRMQEAAILQHSLSEREQAIAAREEQLNKQQKPNSEEPPPNSDVVQDVVTAIYAGDEDATKAALTKLIEGRQQPTQAPTQDTQAVVQQVKTQLAQEAAMDKFLDDYKDVVADPILTKIADDFFAEEQALGKPYAEALEEAGKRTRTWIGDKTPKTATTRTERIAEAKKGIDKIPSTNATAMGSDDAPEESATSIIQGMRKARGLPP